MLTLLVMVAAAIGYAIFATQNTTGIEINLGNYVIPNVPVYLVVLLPLLIGLLASYFIHVAYYLSLKLTIGEKEDELKKLREENADLTKEVHKLELENTKIKSKNGEPVDEDSI